MYKDRLSELVQHSIREEHTNSNLQKVIVSTVLGIRDN
jgi:hypothetical protein